MSLQVKLIGVQRPGLDSSVFQTPPQTHQQTPTPQPDNTSTPPNQNVSNENDGNPNSIDSD